MEMSKCWPMIWRMRLNGKGEAKGQGDDETKIYDGYIRLIGFSTATMSLVSPLRVSSNRIAATKMPRANRLRLAPIFFPSQPFPFKPFTPWYYIQGTSFHSGQALHSVILHDWFIHYAKLWAPWWIYAAIAYINHSLACTFIAANGRCKL